MSIQKNRSQFLEVGQWAGLYAPHAMLLIVLLLKAVELPSIGVLDHRGFMAVRRRSIRSLPRTSCVPDVRTVTLTSSVRRAISVFASAVQLTAGTAEDASVWNVALVTPARLQGDRAPGSSKTHSYLQRFCLPMTILRQPYQQPFMGLHWFPMVLISFNSLTRTHTGYGVYRKRLQNFCPRR